ncbi:DUF4440 domain-containing protein [bacterium]|nr:DUF4440 domain-containing protein [bacterium]
MKTFLTITISLIIFSCTNPKQKEIVTISGKEKEIAKNLIQGAFDNLWGGLDSTKIQDYHTDDFYILEQGEVWDNDRIKGYMRDQLAKEKQTRRVNEMDYLTIEKFGQSINIAYNNKAYFYDGDSLVGQAQWLESALAIPTENGWKLRCMHSTYVPDKK